MKITKFNRIEARTYRNFLSPSELPEFADYNLIYGWNGTGKTTVADILRMVEKRESVGQEGISDFSIAYGPHTITPATIAGLSAPPSIRVFNRAFVDKNVFSDNGPAPIFFIGEENIAKQKELEEKKAALLALREDADKKKKDKAQKEKDLDGFCSANAKTAREVLAITVARHYDKSDFKSDCEVLLSEGGITQYKKSEEDRAALVKATSRDSLPDISPAGLSLPNLAILTDQVRELLQKTVVSKTIESLIGDPATSLWVRDGLQLHKDHDSKNCKFCEQLIPPARFAELEGHFNDEFKTLDNAINAKIAAISTEISRLEVSQLPVSEKFYDDLREKYKDASQNLISQKDDCIKFLNKLLSVLKDKKSSPFSAVIFDGTVPEHGKVQLDAVNAIIVAHNDKTINFNREIENAKKAVKYALAAAAIVEYQELKASLEVLEGEHKALTDKVEVDAGYISTLEQEIINHKKPAEDINKDLEAYLGHNEIHFATKDGEAGYTIMRGEKLARALSEGEKTAIALLHFLKTLQDQNFKLSEGIVVIDDPVCSMDDTSMFRAFSYIKDRTKDAKQLFILTHNFSFFFQVRNWFHYVSSDRIKKALRKGVGFYQTVAALKDGVRTSKLRELDRLLREYNSEYQYLFDVTYKASGEANASGDLEEHYHMPNVARRLLESFLAFRMPNISSGLDKKIEESTFDRTKKISILRFLHTHSHEDHIGHGEHDGSILTETPQIMKLVLEMIAHEDRSHYERMLSLVTPAAANANQPETAKSA